MKANNIRCEYLDRPLSLGVIHPVITWTCDTGVKQTAFKITFYRDGKLVLDTGKIKSSNMSYQVPFDLHSRDHINYEITLFDENDTEGEISKSEFEMSLLDKSDFKASWISSSHSKKEGKRYPVDCFKKTFVVKEVTKARLYITSCGLYECYINSIKVGDVVLAPGHTDYTKRIQLQSYDVTSLLKEGENEITIDLADGWYRGSCGAWGLKNQYGRKSKVYAQLEIYDKEGKEEDILTDSSWSYSNDGPTRFADNKDGEKIDSNKTPSYSSFAKKTSCKVIPTASNNVEVREHEVFSGDYFTTPSGKKVIDFHQNIAGYISFKVNAKKGDIIHIVCGEVIDKDGELTLKNIQCGKKEKVSPKQEITYICKEGLNEYKTRFAIFGFQYCQVDSNLDIQDIHAIAVYSSFENTLEFNCSDKYINKFVLNTLWSAKNNHLDVPTDCPTRERHGWTGDAQIFANTAAFFFNYAPFARKYLRDMTDGQRRNGNFRQITPKGGIDFYMNSMDGSAGWSDAGVLIPYRMYKRYGDKNILSDNYDAMRKYAMHKIKTMGKHYLTSVSTGIDKKYKKWINNYGQSYGEWSEPTDVRSFQISDFISPHPEETTAYLVYMLETMEEIAHILGKEDDAKIYRENLDHARIGYQHLVESPKFSLDTNRQARLVRPLYLHLLNEEQEKYAKEKLIKDLDEYNWRVGTGFLSTPFILYVLADMDVEYAYKLLENKQCPGWLYMVKEGATTIWESWEGFDSRDHYSKGAVCQWLFDSCCGINVDGINHFVIKPLPGGTLTQASCSYDSQYGKVSSKWIKDDSGLHYEIEIPSNTTATVILKGKERVEVGPGKYTF